MTLQNIADKHNVDIDILKKEWKKGVKVEMEHTKDPKVAGRIAKDHLTEDPKYYTKLAKLNLEENLNKDLVSEFMKHVMNELELEKLPKITLSDNSQEAIDLRSWGGYRPGDKSIHIVVAKRHPADIFRTLAHELVHYKQDLDGRLTPTSGETGSDDENEANSRAAVIMRNFAQAKPNLFEHLIKEGEYGDYLFGDKDTGVRIGWYKDKMEVDTPAERALFILLKRYADSEASIYTNISLDSYVDTFKKLKAEYPEIGDPKLSPDAYIYRGTFISQEEAAKLYKNPDKKETIDTIIVPNQEYSSRRKVSSWSTRYYPAAAFAISTSERKNEGVPVVMRAKAGDAELFFNPRFMDKLSDQIEDEVINATNPIKVDVMLIKTYTDEFEDIESGYLSTIKENLDKQQIVDIAKEFIKSNSYNKSHDCKRSTYEFVNWLKKNKKFEPDVLLLAPPKDIKKFPGKSGDGDSHIFAIIGGFGVDFTANQFPGVSEPLKITPESQIPSEYKKIGGYYTDFPDWFEGGKTSLKTKWNNLPNWMKKSF